MCNSDGFTWNMNPVAFANWLGVDYSDASEARKVRKIISDGIKDLKECGFLSEIEKDKYDISEQIVPEWLNSNLGTKSSTQVSSKEQIVPKMVEVKSITSEQIVPEKHGSSLGTKSSEKSAQKEQIVPDCHGF
jgi:predicted 3-demethylubiquinone-9 3-methyltransferase (glyoxalase superfamily)